MLELKKKSDCCGCSACIAACPKGCICMETDSEGFRYPSIDTQRCVDCDLCQRVCPVINEAAIPSHPQSVYAAINHDHATRADSSSGGIFTLIAEHVLSDGGIVFGAAVTEDLKVKHIAVEEFSQLHLLRGSKYVQSDPGDSFRQVKEHLLAGRQVLYTGTPCQIAGLKSYLGQDYDHLICQDIICHGVPSPAVFDAYLQYRSIQADSAVRSVRFRSKSSGWTNYCLYVSFENGTVYEKKFQEDPYMKAFLADLSLRPSCYDCAFKGQQRSADITLADFWGVKNILPEMFDDMGTSLVFVNTPKGNALFSSLQQHMRICHANAEKALVYNRAMLDSVKCPPNRKQFLADIRQMDFAQAVNKACPPMPVWKRLLQKGKRFIKKLVKKSTN